MGRQHVLLLTGQPGIGKTTVLRRVVEDLAGRRVRGFTTEEIRQRGTRVGFRLETLDGVSEIFAHARIASPHRVSRYGIDLSALERIVRRELAPDSGAEVYFVDEIGRMECLSDLFVAAIDRLLDSPAKLVATVAARGEGLIERVKLRRDVKLIRVTTGNRERLSGDILEWIAGEPSEPSVR